MINSCIISSVPFTGHVAHVLTVMSLWCHIPSNIDNHRVRNSLILCVLRKFCWRQLCFLMATKTVQYFIPPSFPLKAFGLRWDGHKSCKVYFNNLWKHSLRLLARPVFAGPATNTFAAAAATSTFNWRAPWKNWTSQYISFFPPITRCSISNVLFTGGRGVSDFSVLKYY